MDNLISKEERDKAIKILQWLHDNNFLFRSTEEDVKYATKLAMQALLQEPTYISELIQKAYEDGKKDGYVQAKVEQESSGDAISRQAVLDMLEDINAETEGVGFYYEHYVDYIKALPSVKPQEPKWIPVSEPPKELGTYLIQTDGEPYMCQCRWTDVNPFWTDYKTKPHWNIFDLPQYSKVVAWMPLPEPYKAESEDKE